MHRPYLPLCFLGELDIFPAERLVLREVVPVHQRQREVEEDLFPFARVPPHQVHANHLVKSAKGNSPTLVPVTEKKRKHDEMFEN